MIPRSVNIRDRRALPLFARPTLQFGRARVCARVCVARADNNYFRNFLAFRATSPSIRKSYKLTVTFTPKFKIRRVEWVPPLFSPGARAFSRSVKYHLIPREIRFNFARRDIPGSPPSNTPSPERRIEIFPTSSSAGKRLTLPGVRERRAAERNQTSPRLRERDRYVTLIVKMLPAKSLGSAILFPRCTSFLSGSRF